MNKTEENILESLMSPYCRTEGIAPTHIIGNDIDKRVIKKLQSAGLVKVIFPPAYNKEGQKVMQLAYAVQTNYVKDFINREWVLYYLNDDLEFIQRGA